MRSHFILNSRAVKACAITGATAMLSSICSAQLAYDSATNPNYSGGWSAGQNGGTGFGAWSFNGTQSPPTGTYQGMSSASSLGTAWTLMSPSAGQIANAGRSINGGLQPGQEFQTLIQNPVNSQGYYTYGGFDILFTSGTDNNQPGDNTSALRLSVFDYYNAALNWAVNDATHTSKALNTGLSAITTGASGMLVDLTLYPGNGYVLTLAPASHPNSPYFSTSGTLASSIDYVDFRTYGSASTGLNDTADNLSVGNMEVLAVPEPASWLLCGVGSISFMLWRRRRK